MRRCDNPLSAHDTVDDGPPARLASSRCRDGGVCFTVMRSTPSPITTDPPLARNGFGRASVAVSFTACSASRPGVTTPAGSVRLQLASRPSRAWRWRYRLRIAARARSSCPIVCRGSRPGAGSRWACIASSACGANSNCAAGRNASSMRCTNSRHGLPRALNLHSQSVCGVRRTRAGPS